MSSPPPPTPAEVRQRQQEQLRNEAGIDSHDDQFSELDLNVPTPLQKLRQKIISEPVVPIGCALTVAALLSASNALRKGNRERFQTMLRYRVLAQGATVVGALGTYMYYYPTNQAKKAREGEVAAEIVRRDRIRREERIMEAEARQESEARGEGKIVVGRLANRERPEEGHQPAGWEQMEERKRKKEQENGS